ncbi:hypothetical protein HDU83_008553 [Entophlyctis luteolus]|nr:hypothetical protein HDU83_008553 [Entophlyctis luteolus]
MPRVPPGGHSSFSFAAPVAAPIPSAALPQRASIIAHDEGPGSPAPVSPRGPPASPRVQPGYRLSSIPFSNEDTPASPAPRKPLQHPPPPESGNPGVPLMPHTHTHTLTQIKLAETKSRIFSSAAPDVAAAVPAPASVTSAVAPTPAPTPVASPSPRQQAQALAHITRSIASLGEDEAPAPSGRRIFKSPTEQSSSETSFTPSRRLAPDAPSNPAVAVNPILAVPAPLEAQPLPKQANPAARMNLGGSIVLGDDNPKDPDFSPRKFKNTLGATQYRNASSVAFTHADPDVDDAGSSKPAALPKVDPASVEMVAGASTGKHRVY